ncbi:MAG: hypothetical protein IKO51_06235 [Clostridia bacterium]|nr:hypothetical protein [Clostridia bacterium]
MKKNWTTRVAVALLALTMITSCFVGSTFAKYVTRAEGEDNARVAKWGILLGMEGDDMFAPEYEADDESFTGSDDNDDPILSVRVDPDYDGDITDLVAPGTTNDGFKATIVGKPEVAVRYTLHIDPDWSDVVLPAGEYTDFTKLVKKGNEQSADDPEYGYYDTFTLDEDYAPVKWDIKVSKNGGTPIGLVEYAFAFNEQLALAMGMTRDGVSATNAANIVKTYSTQLANLLLSMLNDQGEAGASNAVFTVADDGTIDLSIDFDPNRSLDFEFSLAWKWPFEQGEKIEENPDIYEFDAADTWLGNFVAYKEFGECEDYAEEFDAAEQNGAAYTIGFKFTATATQID